MININDFKNICFYKNNDIETNEFFEFGAHFKYKDLYNKLLEIINKRKINKVNNINNLNKKDVNEGISRNQINNNNDDNLVFSLKNIYNIFSKYKLNDSSRKNNNKKDFKSNKKKEKNQIKIKKNNVLKPSILKKQNENQKSIKQYLNNNNIENNCSKSFSQTRNLSYSIIKNRNIMELIDEKNIRNQFSNLFNLKISKLINKHSILKKLSPIKNINNSNKSNSNIIKKLKISISINERENKKNIIENNKSLSNNTSLQSSASTEKNTNITSYVLVKNKKIIHLKKKYDNHNLCYKQNAETVPCEERNILKNFKGKENDILSILLNKRKKKKINISDSKNERNFILKHSIFQSNRINNSIHNKKNSNSNLKKEHKFTLY